MSSTEVINPQTISACLPKEQAAENEDFNDLFSSSSSSQESRSANYNEKHRTSSGGNHGDTPPTVSTASISPQVYTRSSRPTYEQYKDKHFGETKPDFSPRRRSRSRDKRGGRNVRYDRGAPRRWDHSRSRERDRKRSNSRNRYNRNNLGGNHSSGRRGSSRRRSNSPQKKGQWSPSQQGKDKGKKKQMSTTEILNKHFGVKPLYPYQKKCLKREDNFNREEQNYVYELLHQVQTLKRERHNETNENSFFSELFKKPGSNFSTSKHQNAGNPQDQRNLDQKIHEAVKLAEYFYLLNETQWNFFDDEFYIVNRRWFDKWKAYVQYDYIVKHVMEEKKNIKDLSMNKLLNSGGCHPGDITNKFLLMESKEFYHNRIDDRDISNFPLKEDCILNRDYILTNRSVWKILKQDYEGTELIRYSLAKDKLGRLFREAQMPRLKITIMRRGDRLKYPKTLNLNRKITFNQMKSHLKNIFQFLQDCSLSEIRFWVLNDDMQLDEFVTSYNQSIADNMTHTYEFPGQSLEKSLDSYVDEYKALQQSKTLFIEVKKANFQWLFNLDFLDQSKFYKPSESEVFKLPYMINDLDDKESFFEYNFNYNQYWKVRNNQQTRDYFDQAYND